MAEAAEESGKENYRNGWPPGGRKFSEIDRESPAAREATEKENTAAAGSGRPVGGRFQRNTESPPQHPQHWAFLSGKMPVAARALLGLAGCIFRQKRPHKENAAAEEPAEGRVQRQVGGGSHQADFKTRCKLSSN